MLPRSTLHLQKQGCRQGQTLHRLIPRESSSPAKQQFRMCTLQHAEASSRQSRQVLTLCRLQPMEAISLCQAAIPDWQRPWANGHESQQPAVKSGADLVQTEAEGGQQPSQADDGHPQVAQAVLHQQVATLQRGLEGDGFAAGAARCAPASLDKGEPAGQVGGSNNQSRL